MYTWPRGGRGSGPYADSLPQFSHFQGGGGRGGAGSEGGVGASLKGGGLPDPNIYGLK